MIEALAAPLAAFVWGIVIGIWWCVGRRRRHPAEYLPLVGVRLNADEYLIEPGRELRLHGHATGAFDLHIVVGRRPCDEPEARRVPKSVARMLDETLR